MKKYDIAIIGAGASGLSAAAESKYTAEKHNRSLSVVLFEKEEKCAKKLSATGNGKCNLANKIFDLSFYEGSRSLLNKTFDVFSNDDNIDFFASIGVPVYDDASGRLYPMSRKASSVCDALFLECKRLSVDMVFSHEVCNITRQNGFFIIDGEYQAEKIIFSFGSKAGLSPKSHYNGTELLKKCNVKFNRFYPCLCGLILDGSYPYSLKGVRHICNVCAVCGNKTVFSEVGEVQFNEKGVSGIPVMQASIIVSRLLSEGKKVKLLLDFLPDIDSKALTDTVISRAGRFKNLPSEKIFTGYLPKQIYVDALKRTFLKSSEPLPKDKKRLAELAYNMKYTEYSVKDTVPFENAQVCAGGIDSSQLTERLELKNNRGIFVSGEIADVVGRCGGYNLSWCWSSGRLAGKSCAEDIINGK